MNNHWKIPRKIENQSENDFNKKVGLHTLICGGCQTDNKDITQLVGLHRRCPQCKKNQNTYEHLEN